jgi:hypothetical protein
VRRLRPFAPTVGDRLFFILLPVSLACAALVGYASGRSRQANWLATIAIAPVAAVMAMALFDLDHPRRDMIRTGQQTTADFRADIFRED